MSLDDELSLPAFEVLIIEDNEPDAELLEAYIEGSPVEAKRISHVKTLGEGVETATRLQPDLIFLDLSLGDASAPDTLDAISEMPSGAAVVVLTGNARPELELLALESGADEFLSKNELNVEQLTRRVHRAHGRNKVRYELERTRRAVDGASQGIIICDARADDLPIVYCNQGFSRITGYERDEILGRNCRFLQCDETSEASVDQIRDALDKQKAVTVTLLNEKKGGERFWNDLSITPVFNQNGELIEYIGLVRDATRRVRAENELRARQKELETYETIIENTTDAVFITRPDGTYEFVNRRFAELVGTDEQKLTGETPDEFERLKSGQFSAPERLGNRSSEVDHREHQVNLGDERRTFLTTQIPVTGIDESDGVIGISRDVTQEKQLRDELQRHALFDELTGLPNRTLFRDRLNQALLRSNRGESNIAVAFIDVDEFKLINDTHGHTSGDIVLKNAADRLQYLLESADTIARHGGDEFMVLLESETGAIDFDAIGQAIREGFEAPIQLDNSGIPVTLSIGFAAPQLVGSDATQDQQTLGDKLVRAADRAMYRAKEESETSWAIFDTDTPELQPESATRENRIYEGIRRGEFVPFFQPIFTLPSQRLVALEVLARWEKGEQGIVGPGEFIPLAEQSRLICRIGEEIAEKACEAHRQTSITNNRGHQVPLYINLSPKQLECQEDVDSLVDLLAQYLDDFDVGLEVTETQLLQSFDPLNDIAKQGIDIIVDDFGTGYSSFDRIKDIEIDALKLDMRFVHGAVTNDADAAIVETIGTLGQRLSLPIIGEGVETARELQFLIDAGLTAAQGYFLARPQPLDALVELLSDDTPRSQTLADDTIPER